MLSSFFLFFRIGGQIKMALNEILNKEGFPKYQKNCLRECFLFAQAVDSQLKVFIIVGFHLNIIQAEFFSDKFQASQLKNKKGYTLKLQNY